MMSDVLFFHHDVGMDVLYSFYPNERRHSSWTKGLCFCLAFDFLFKFLQQSANLHCDQSAVPAEVPMKETGTDVKCLLFHSLLFTEVCWNS